MSPGLAGLGPSLGHENRSKPPPLARIPRLRYKRPRTNILYASSGFSRFSRFQPLG